LCIRNERHPNILEAVVDLINIKQEKCFGDKDAMFSIDITGGTPPYTVTLDNIATTTITGTSAQTRFDFPEILGDELAGGDHIVQIVDVNNCPFDLPVPLDLPVDIAPEVTVDYGCPTIAEPLINTVIVTPNPDLDPKDLTYMLDGVPYESKNVYLANDGVFQNVSVGQHTVLVKHKDGCEQLAKDIVTKEEFFIVKQVDPIAVLLTQGGLNEIVATVEGGSGGNVYVFNGEDNGTNNKYIYYKTGDYTVVVTDENGCKATDTKPFVFIDIKIPELFTPNGDGSNDTWHPTETQNYPDLVFYVFDRYGRKVGTFGEGQGWDGKYNGAELPTGDYWYTLKLRNLKDDREFVGHFTLYR
jgi:large repetitive protein